MVILRPHRRMIPAAKQKSLDDLKEQILGGPPKTLEKIHKTKTFIAAKLNGHSTVESRHLAGIPPGTNTKSILNSPIGKVFVSEYVDREMTDPVKLEKLKELWNAHEPIVSNGIITGRKPAWGIQQEAFNTVLELQGYKRKQQDDSGDRPVTIVFNTLPIPTPPTPVVEIPSSKSTPEV